MRGKNKTYNRKESWGGWYLTVLLALIVQIALYYWFTRYWK